MSVTLWVLFTPTGIGGRGGYLIIATVALAALYAVAEAWPLSLEHRGETFAFTLNGGPLAIGLVFAGPIPTLAGRLIGTTVVLVMRKQSPLKMAVNLTGMSLEVWAAAHVFRMVAGTSITIEQPMGWVAVGLAVVAADLVTGGVVLTAIRLSVGRLAISAVRAVMVGSVINFAVGIPLAVLAVLVLAIDLRSAVVLIPVAALLAITNKERHTLAARLGTTQQLYRFISDLAEPTSMIGTLERVLEKAQQVTGATRTELILITADQTATRWRVTADGVVAEDLPGIAVRRLIGEAAGGLLLAGRDVLMRRYAELLPGGAEQVVVARIVQPDLQGLLIMADRAGNLALFDSDDVEVACAIAGHAGTALAEAGLLERLRAEATERKQMALTDRTTGMPNREGLLARTPTLRQGVVMVVEVRDLTEFEAGFGHAVAEGLATTVGARVALALRSRDVILARLSAGRYAVVGLTATSQAGAAALARQLVEAGSGAVDQGDLVIDVRSRVGVALAPMHGTDVAELLRAADRGLREAMENDRSTGWFDIERDRETTRRLELASELGTAIDEGHLRLAYQPKVDLQTGRVVGMEALARWPHAERGFIAPIEFIDVAERTGLIRPLTLWATQTALQQTAEWRRQGTELTMAINLSNAALLHADIARDIVALIDRFELPAGSVVLEITESLVMGDVQRGGGALSIFNAAGIPLSVDDFGTGYSSLAHLKTLDVQEIKIDRAFITHLASDPTDRALCSAIIGMAQELGLQVVGEGIEDGAALTILRDLGCQIGQGHFLARPVPANQVPIVVAEIEGRLVDGSISRMHERMRRQQ